MIFRGSIAVGGENRMNQTELFDIRMRDVAKTSLPEYRRWHVNDYISPNRFLVYGDFMAIFAAVRPLIEVVGVIHPNTCYQYVSRLDPFWRGVLSKNRFFCFKPQVQQAHKHSDPVRNTSRRCVGTPDRTSAHTIPVCSTVATCPEFSR